MKKRRAEKMFSARRQRILQGRPSCLFFLAAVGGLHALLVVEDGLADTQIIRCNFQQLIIRQKFQALLQTHLPRRHQPQRIIGAGGTGVGLLLFLADIYGDVLLLGRHAYHHTLVHLHARADKERKRARR